MRKINRHARAYYKREIAKSLGYLENASAGQQFLLLFPYFDTVISNIDPDWRVCQHFIC